MAAKILIADEEYTFEVRTGWQGPDETIVAELRQSLLLVLPLSVVFGSIERLAVEVAQKTVGRFNVEVIEPGRLAPPAPLPDGAIR